MVALYVTRQGEKLTEGARLLWLAMKRVGLTQEALRAKLGISRGAIGRWVRGDRVPDRSSRERLKDMFSIAIEDWERKPRRPVTFDRS
jgi:transcriptional regulator with XRE-family HTH domain